MRHIHYTRKGGQDLTLMVDYKHEISSELGGSNILASSNGSEFNALIFRVRMERYISRETGKSTIFYIDNEKKKKNNQKPVKLKGLTAREALRTTLVAISNCPPTPSCSFRCQLQCSNPAQTSTSNDVTTLWTRLYKATTYTLPRLFRLC